MIDWVEIDFTSPLKWKKKMKGLTIWKNILPKQNVYKILQQIHAKEILKNMLTNYSCYTKEQEWQLIL